MTFFVSWVVYPTLLLALSLGAGMGLRRVAGEQALPGVLVLPAGFAAIVTVAAFTTQFDATAELTAPSILAIAVAGWLAGRRSLREVRPSWSWSAPALAGFLPFATTAAPVVLTGQPGLTGYTRIPDLMHQLQFTDWIIHSGRATPPAAAVDSSFTETVVKMIGVGYPGGAQGALGGTSALIGADPIWSYQPFLAAIAAGLGLALYSLLSNAIPSRGWRALAAGVAAQPTILYSYGLAAGIKELSAIAAITLVAALLFARRPGQARVRELTVVAVATAAAFAVFNLGIIPWIGVLFAFVLAADLWSPAGRIRALVRWSGLGLMVAILSVPTIAVAVKLAPVARAGGPPDLGNLAAPVPAWSAVGPWFTADHRFPLDVAGDPTVTHVFVGVVLACSVLGLLWSLRRRDLRLLALAAAGVVALVFVSRRAGPWVDLKAYTITAPITLSLAFTGAAALARLPGRARWLAPVVSVVVAGSVLVGNALVYHDTTITPYARFVELERIAERYAGEGPALHTSLDDYPEYLLRDVKLTGMFNPPRPGLRLRPDAPSGTPFTRDLDGFVPAYVQSFPLLILRRDPTMSRPPSNYRLVQRMDYYDVWKQTAPAATVVAHVPLTGRRGERTATMCDNVARRVRRAGDGGRLVYATASESVQTGPALELPVRWLSDGADYLGEGPGRLRLPVTLPADGRYRVLLRGSVGRAVRILVDDQPFARVRLDESFPLQYIPLRTAALDGGRHLVTIVRGGGGLLPSSGNDPGPDGATTRFGPVAFVPADEPSALRSVTARQTMEVCRGAERLDWMEIVRRG